MSWEGIKTQLGEVYDAYADPIKDRLEPKPFSVEELKEKLKNKEIGTKWYNQEIRKLNALKDLVPEKRQEQIASGLSSAGQAFNRAWEGAETVENWLDPFDVGAAGVANTVNVFNQGVGLLSQGAAAAIHHGLRVDKRASNLAGSAASLVLTKKLMSGTSNLLRSGQLQQATRNILPTSRFNPASKQVIKAKATRVSGPGITAESSATIAKKYPWITGNKPQPYAFAYDNSQGGSLLKDAIRDPLLSRSNVPVSQAPLGKSLKPTGIGLFNRTEAEGIRELVLTRVVDRLDAPNQFIKNTLQPLYPNQNVTSLSTREVNKLIKEQGLWGEYKKLQRETKALKRSKSDWSQTDIEDLHELGVFQELKNKNFSQLEPENIESWLKVQEGRVSASKGLDARHHMYLSSSKDVLDPKNVPVKWRKEYISLAKDKYDKFGSGSVISQDIGGHKSFDTTKDPGQPWNVKGRLNETLKKYTNLPRGKTGNIISPKVDRNPKTDAPIFNLSTQEGKLQKILFDMKQKTSHGYWSNLETGFTIDSRLANYKPEVALSVAEHIYDIERVIGEQGLIVTKQLELWQNRIDTGKLGTPPDMDKALIELQKRIDKIKIPDIEGMKKLYEQDLNTLLTKGEEALRQQQANRITN